MRDNQTAPLPQELEEIAFRLELERPRLSAMELDRVSKRVGIGPRWSVGKNKNRKAHFLKTRLATALALSVGVLFGGSGLAMGVTALQSTDNASESVYGDNCRATNGNGNCNDVLGESESGGPAGSDVLGESESGAPAGGGAGKGSGGSVDGPAGTQAVAQGATAKTDLSSLPFTGYLAVPALVLGLVFIGSGLMLRRAARE